MLALGNDLGRRIHYSGIGYATENINDDGSVTIDLVDDNNME